MLVSKDFKDSLCISQCGYAEVVGGGFRSLRWKWWVWWMIKNAYVFCVCQLYD